MIGFGSLVNNYTNTTSYEKRKVGLHYDFNVKGLVGFEGLYSDVNPSSLNLLAVRPYVRPLIWTSIPIVRTFEIGTTVIKDKDQTKQPTQQTLPPPIHLLKMVLAHLELTWAWCFSIFLLFKLTFLRDTLN